MHKNKNSAAVCAWQKRNPEKVNAKQRMHHARAKRAVIAGYGGKCACCHEDNHKFLTLDHVHGGGSAERGRNRTNRTTWSRAIREGFPPDLQLLCWNCNCGRQFNNGVCPHIEDR